MKTIGWNAAATRSGLPRTSLRRLVAKGQLTPTRGPDGVWTFDERDLDQLREARGKATPIADGTVVPPAATAATSMATTTPPIPSWLLQAAARRDGALGIADEVDELDNDEDDSRSVNVNATPLGSTRSPQRGLRFAVLAQHEAQAAANAQSLQAEVASVTAQLAAARGELAAQIEITATWRVLYRSTRVKAIADMIAGEAIAAGARPAAAQIAAQAAADAVSRLPDEQIVHDGIALGLARQVGHAAGGWASQVAHAVTWNERGESDVERARVGRRRRGRGRL